MSSKYLVYEFTFHNFDDDIEEQVGFFGIYNGRNSAKKMAIERVMKGIEKENCIPENLKYDEAEDPDCWWNEKGKSRLEAKENIIKKIKRAALFHNNDSVVMCRVNDRENLVYTINIREFKKEKGAKKYE